MRKFQIIATRPLQIDGLPEAAAGDQVLGTIETSCNIGSLLRCLEHGNATLVPADEDEPQTSGTGDGQPDASTKKKRTSRAAAR